MSNLSITEPLFVFNIDSAGPIKAIHFPLTYSANKESYFFKISFRLLSLYETND